LVPYSVCVRAGSVRPRRQQELSIDVLSAARLEYEGLYKRENGPAGAWVSGRHFLSNVTRSLSFVSATKMASSFAGSVSLAFSLIV
jgi:hypothetical protein